MAFFRTLKWNAAPVSLASVALGIILILFPQMAAKSVCYALAAVVFIGGIGFLVSFFSCRRQNLPAGMDLAIGLFLWAAAVYLIIRAERIILVIPLIMGAVFAVNGAVKLQRSLDLKKAQYRGWSLVMLYALLTVGFGVVLLYNPFQTVKMMVRILGIGLLISGFSDVFTMISVSRQILRHRLPGVSKTE